MTLALWIILIVVVILLLVAAGYMGILGALIDLIADIAMFWD